MEQAYKGALSKDLKALQETIDALPPAGDEEQAQVLSALEELMANLNRLTRTVEGIETETDDQCN